MEEVIKEKKHVILIKVTEGEYSGLRDIAESRGLKVGRLVYELVKSEIEEYRRLVSEQKEVC